MQSLCKFRNLFGEPGQGAHAVRVFGLAAVDVAGTLALAWATQRTLLPDWAYWKVFLATFALGELLHWLFCVDTALLRALGA